MKQPLTIALIAAILFGGLLTACGDETPKPTKPPLEATYEEGSSSESETETTTTVTETTTTATETETTKPVETDEDGNPIEETDETTETTETTASAAEAD